ncbi:MAG: MarR family transcriptional regulator [Nocardioides sp.]|nr:MarR family transcriptional regulator [Nocardioides sp.]
MGDRFEAIEFEALLLGRHLSPTRRTSDGKPYLERSAYMLLIRLNLEGPMSIGGLSDAFGLDTSTLNRQTAAMMRAGLVDRIPDPDGGLARKFLITEAGRNQLNTERRTNIDGLRNILGDWSGEDVATLAALLRRFNSDVEDRDGRPWPRP